MKTLLRNAIRGRGFTRQQAEILERTHSGKNIVLLNGAYVIESRSSIKNFSNDHQGHFSMFLCFSEFGYRDFSSFGRMDSFKGICTMRTQK